MLQSAKGTEGKEMGLYCDLIDPTISFLRVAIRVWKGRIAVVTSVCAFVLSSSFVLLDSSMASAAVRSVSSRSRRLCLVDNSFSASANSAAYFPVSFARLGALFSFHTSESSSMKCFRPASGAGDGLVPALKFGD